jgi:sulfite exporter TauE/SafE
VSEILPAAFFSSTLGVLVFGFLLGLKHATESDHLAAVTTIVSERKSLWSSAIIGGIWGLGHTISLFVAGIFVLLLNFQISEQTERILEFCVGVMLVLLGLNVLRKLLRGDALHFHAHSHGSHTHAHPHLHAHAEQDESHTHHGFSFNPRSLIIGMIHGLAGSAALMLLIVPTIESRPLGLLYILIFGAGSIGGMMLMSFLVGLPFSLTARKFNRLNAAMQTIAGIISVGVGLFVVYEKGITEGLLG